MVFQHDRQQGAEDRGQTLAQAQTRVIDAGLQAHMRKTYNYMSVGLLVTGLVAFVVANIPPLAQLLLGTPLKWVVLFAPLALLFFGFTQDRIARWPAAKLRGMFYLLAAIMGMTFAGWIFVFTGASIARTFFATAAMFAGVSLYGYTTRRDLTGMGAFLMMGAIGIFFAMLFNLIFKSEMVMFIVSILGVFVFAGLAAFNTQRIKESYSASYGEEANTKMAVMGALTLYYDFIMIFQFLMQFLGEKR